MGRTGFTSHELCSCWHSVFPPGYIRCSINPGAKNSRVINLQTQLELSAWFQRWDAAAEAHLKALTWKNLNNKSIRGWGTPTVYIQTQETSTLLLFRWENIETIVFTVQNNCYISTQETWNNTSLWNTEKGGYIRQHRKYKLCFHHPKLTYTMLKLAWQFLSNHHRPNH